MHRVDASGNVNNRFSNGNPSAGQLATALEQDWHNSVQEEIATVIERAGIALNKQDNAQLHAAIVAIATGAVGSGGASVPTARRVDGTGIMAGQGGALVADLLLGPQVASPGETIAALINNKVLTPASVGGAFSRNLSSSGHIVMPFGGGFMLEWVTGLASANTQTILNWPVTFPTQCLAAWCNGGKVESGIQDNGPFVSGYGASNVSVHSVSQVGVIAIGIGF